ncbi:MAG: DUF2203 domain-containing protein [Nitrososphaera sp.]|jgi:hypothetical protein
MFALYTPESANKALPDVRRIFNRIVDENKRVILLHNELQSIIESGSKFDLFLKKKAEINSSMKALYSAIEELEGKGVLIKSIEQGLVDFPSVRFGEEVWLCWKSGEESVKFWHGKDEGFMGRKPLGNSGYSDDLEKLR